MTEPLEFTDKLGKRWVDDPTIADEDIVYRRIHPHRREQLDDGTWIMQSGAFDFDDDGGPMSVYLHSEMVSLDLQPVDALADHPGYTLASAEVGKLRNQEAMAIVRDMIVNPPKPHQCDDAHAVAAGNLNTKRRRRVRNLFSWVISPDDLEA